MKKTKIIIISILGLLLLVPFMTPTRAAPASYVPVAEEEEYLWELSVYYPNNTQFNADGMSTVMATIFGTPAAWQISKVYFDWSNDPPVYPQSSWPLTVKSILPENTSTFLSDYFIFANITHTPVYLGAGFYALNWPGLGFDLFYDATWYIVNDTASFAAQSLYGAQAFSPYTLMGVPFGPKNINWTVFAGLANWGMSSGFYWQGDAVNVTVTALSDGYSLYVPALGFQNNTLPITINTTYTTDGILNNYTFEYGALTLFFYELASYSPDVVNPVTTATQSDFTVAHNYTGQGLSWTATDANPSTYTITLNGTTTVVSATAWTSGGAVTYNIPDGLAPGDHTYEIIFLDTNGHNVSDTAVMTVNPATTPTPTPAIPGFEPLIVIGITGIASISLIIFKKKKK